MLFILKSKLIPRKYKPLIEDISSYLRWYKNNFYSYIKYQQATNEEQQIVQNSAIFLMRSLQRSRFLLQDFIHALKINDPLLGSLCTRAHLEVTGAVAHYYLNTVRFQQQKINIEELDLLLRQLSLGGRTFPDKNKPQFSHRPDAINVLSFIDSLDKLFKEMGSPLKAPFRDEYDFLSEICHPNFLGMTFGSDIILGWGVYLYRHPKFNKHDYQTLLGNIVISCSMFKHAYCKCFDVLKNIAPLPEFKSISYMKFRYISAWAKLQDRIHHKNISANGSSLKSA